MEQSKVSKLVKCSALESRGLSFREAARQLGVAESTLRGWRKKVQRFEVVKFSPVSKAAKRRAIMACLICSVITQE